MIKYGLDTIDELKFQSFTYSIEVRDQNWIDIILHPHLSSLSALPKDIEDFALLIITNYGGEIAQMVPQDSGCDSEYQLTFSEKEQVKNFIYSEIVQEQIVEAIQASEQDI